MQKPGHYHLRLLARITLAVGLSALVSSGCGRRITDENLDQVHQDMSKKEVESILGQPTEIKSHELTLQTQMKTLQATRYYYEQEGQKVELIFVADKLVGKNGHFEIDGVVATRVAEKANSDAPIPGVNVAGPMTLNDEIDLGDGTIIVKETAAPIQTPEDMEPPLPIREQAAGTEPTPPVITEGLE